MGAVTVIAYGLEKGIAAIDMYQDYEGVARWALGDWKTNKEGTKKYAEYCKKASESLTIRYVKVKGHSGDKYNDEADMLAKKALGI